MVYLLTNHCFYLPCRGIHTPHRLFSRLHKRGSRVHSGPPVILQVEQTPVSILVWAEVLLQWPSA